jgi:hypothetical protein
MGLVLAVVVGILVFGHIPLTKKLLISFASSASAMHQAIP